MHERVGSGGGRRPPPALSRRAHLDGGDQVLTRKPRTKPLTIYVFTLCIHTRASRNPRTATAAHYTATRTARTIAAEPNTRTTTHERTVKCRKCAKWDRPTRMVRPYREYSHSSILYPFLHQFLSVESAFSQLCRHLSPDRQLTMRPTYSATTGARIVALPQYGQESSAAG